MSIQSNFVLYFFFKQYDAAIGIYWHINPAYFSLIGTSLFKKKFIAYWQRRFWNHAWKDWAFSSELTNKVRNTKKDQVYMKNLFCYNMALQRDVWQCELLSYYFLG